MTLRMGSSVPLPLTLEQSGSGSIYGEETYTRYQGQSCSSVGSFKYFCGSGSHK